jgi:hypothetical protein
MASGRAGRGAAALGAVGVYETALSLARLAWHRRRDRDDRGVVSDQPALPFVRELGPVCDGVQRALADRAPPLLSFEKPPTGVVDRQRGFASSPGPVVSQGRLVRRRPVSDDLVADDPGPGETVQVGAACAVAEHPPVLPGSVELCRSSGQTPTASTCCGG